MAYCFDSTEDDWLYQMYRLEMFTIQRVFGTVDVLVIITSKNHSLNNISVSHRTFLFSRRDFSSLSTNSRPETGIYFAPTTCKITWMIMQWNYFPTPLPLCYYSSYYSYTYNSWLLFSGTIRAVVGIMVLNKTSEEYWFLMQFNVSQVSGEVDIVDGNETIDFFLIRFHLDSG